MTLIIAVGITKTWKGKRRNEHPFKNIGHSPMFLQKCRSNSWAKKDNQTFQRCCNWGSRWIWGWDQTNCEIKQDFFKRFQKKVYNQSIDTWKHVSSCQVQVKKKTGYFFLDQLCNFFHELFCQFISWINWVNSGKFIDNCWISCQVMADMKKVCNDLIINNL